MWDFLIDLVVVNETIRYDLILMFVLMYFLAIWAVVTVWVYGDAKSRYEDMRIAFLWGLLVFMLSVPMLMLYLVLRPEDQWMKKLGERGSLDADAVTIPITQFVGEDGKSVISFQLQVNPEALTDATRAMNIEVNWGRDVEHSQIERAKIESPKSSMNMRGKMDMLFGKIQKSRIAMQQKGEQLRKLREERRQQEITKVEINKVESDKTEGSKGQLDEEIKAVEQKKESDQIFAVAPDQSESTQIASVTGVESTQQYMDGGDNQISRKKKKKKKKRSK